MTPSITQALVTAYARGTASPAEAEAVRTWLAQPANQLLATYWLQEHWHELAATLPLPAASDDPDFEQLLADLHPRLAPPVAPLYRAPPVRWRRWAAAATLASAVAVGGWLYQNQHRPAPAAVLAARTTYGQTRTLRLSDGSVVTLNGHSQLRYATTWAPGQPREVWLQGEGYFAIQHTADNQRFLVHTDAGLQVEVLGTQFVVARRRTQTRVVLLQGKVRVEFDDRRQPDVLLKPGELVETQDAPTPGSAPVVTAHQRVHTAPYSTWKDAELVLDETTIAELATRLHDTYGLDVEVTTPELNSRRVTGTVPVGELDVLLQALQETFHLRITRQGNRLTLAE
jgi:ferric-dicitrate binding protein FerR (iron transport regulator)